MKHYIQFTVRCVGGVLIASNLFVQAVTASAAISLQQAEELAVKSDPLINANIAKTEALKEDSVADGQLQDPKFRTGIVNVPLDDFKLDKNSSTQFRMAIQQAFPRGDTLEFRQQRTQWLSTAQNERTEDEKRQVIHRVRQLFLEVYFQIKAGNIIDTSRVFFSDLVLITRAQFAAGRVNQQDVLRAQLELSRLDDRRERIKNDEDVSRSTLQKWISEFAWQPLLAEYPTLPDIPNQTTLVEMLQRHPLVNLRSALVETSRRSINIAQQQYKPGWNVSLEYRKRFGDNPDGSNREDMMAAMVTLDIPLFTAKRQDKRLAASKRKADAAKYERLDILRNMKSAVASEFSKLKILDTRFKLYKTNLLPEATANAEASLKAYQSGLTEFTTLMRARLTELDVQIDELRIRIDRSITKAHLLYLVTEEQK